MSSTYPDRRGADRRTRVIAHRGASGYLPEHTAEAKTLAYGLGVDFLEQDVVATGDGVLVVLHDVYLDDVSNVAARFPERRREDGFFYVIDFTFAELSELSLHERRRAGSDELRYPGRFPYDLDGFRVSRFEDEIRLVSGLNASTGGHVGIYPEIKDPVWHEIEGFDLTARIHDALVTQRELISGPIFLQSFDARTLRRLRSEFNTELPLIQLLEREDAVALLNDADARAAIAEHAQGVGLPYETLLQQQRINGKPASTGLAETLADTGLLVHPYTLRRDVAPPGSIDYFEVLAFLIHELGVDAIFCDHPDDAIAVRAGSAA